MIYVYYGDNSDKRQAAVNKVLKSLKKPVAQENIYAGDASVIEKIKINLDNPSLFGGSVVVVMERPFSEGESEEGIMSLLKEMQNSQTVFIITELKLSKNQIKDLKKHAEDMEGFENAKAVKSAPFNSFAFADALGRRDKKGLWVLLNRAGKAGVSGEEIHGILFWQIKTLLLLAREKGKSATALDINPFVYRKAEGFLKNYTLSELQKISSQLVSALYQGRIDGRDTMASLERFILSAI